MQYVVLKGKGDGLILQLDDRCSFQELFHHVEQFVTNYKGTDRTPIHLHFGYRYCTEEQMEDIVGYLDEYSPFDVLSADSYVLTKEQCKRYAKVKETTQHVGVVRSGQTIRADGDLLIIGDVNQNGEVVANGNIYILGTLKGKAHAGAEGNERAIIAASHMVPTHLKIANVIELITEESSLYEAVQGMACAYLHPNGRISVGKLAEVRRDYPSLMTNRGGV